MNTIRRVLFSVLLSAFGFFVVHDFVIADVDADTQYELCDTKQGIIALDLPSQIHEHIHILLSIPETEPKLPLEIPDAARPLATLQPVHSYISPTPTRPPLA